MRNMNTLDTSSQRRVYTKGRFHVIMVDEELHLSSDIVWLREHVEAVISKGQRDFAIGFTPGSYLCSRSGAALVACWEMTKDCGGEFVIISPNRDIVDFLAIIDMAGRIKIVKSEDELA